MTRFFLVFLSALIFRAFLYPLLPLPLIFSSIIFLLCTLTIFFLIKKQRIKTAVSVLLLISGLAGFAAGTRYRTPSVPPNREVDSRSSYFTNIQVTVSRFPQAVRQQDDTGSLGWMLPSGKNLKIYSPLLGDYHPGQVLQISGRFYHFHFEGRDFYRMYVSPYPDINTALPPIDPALQSEIESLELVPPLPVIVVSERYRFLGWFSQLRKKASRKIFKLNSSTHQALLFSMILGNRHWLSFSAREAFRAGGLSHILALSGLHIGILSLCLIWLFSLFLSRTWTYGLTSAFILFFMLFSGLSPSIMRAGFLFISYTLLRTLGHDPDWMDLLSFTAFVILTIYPGWLTDPGFLLSYAATLGIVMFAPALQRRLLHIGIPRIPADPFSLSLTATISTAPLIVYFFGGISLVSLLTNLLALPLFFILLPLLLLHFPLIMAGLESTLLTRLSDLLWTIIFRLSDWLTRPEWTYQEMEKPSFWFILLIYLLIPAGFILIPRLIYSSRKREQAFFSQ